MGKGRLGGCEGVDRGNLSSADDRRRTAWRPMVWLLASALVTFGTAEGLAAPHKGAPAAASPTGASSAASPKPASAQRKKTAAVARKKHKAPREKIATKRPGHVINPAAAGDVSAPLPPDLATAKQALQLIRKGQTKEAAALAASLSDPVVAKLVAWARLRHPDREIGFERYADFINTNPDWPSVPLLRRRAEARLWQEHRDTDTVRRFIGEKPLSPMGRLPLPRAAMAKSAKGGALLNAVPAEARGDLGYALCRITWLLRNDTPGSNIRGRIVTPKNDMAAAAKLALAGSPDDLRRQDTDEWWRARRALARKLIDLGDPETAYNVVRTAAPPANPYYEADVHFMAGWIALRFLADPAGAREHFAHIDEGKTDPVTLSRAAYWRGRAAEAAGDLDDMQSQYQAAARYGTTYYGQLGRARLGFADLALSRPAPEPVDEGSNELLRAATILYQMGEGDLALSFLTDLAAESSDPAVISGLGKLAARYKDAQAMLVVGKTALGRGLPMDHYAFPDIGVPNYKPVASPLDRCIVYAVVRTESGFDQADRSAAKAVGLMQVTPGAARDTAKRFGVSYNWDRLVSGPVHNTQLGAGEISALLKDYRGSLLLTFAGYNAGRGRVQQWMAQHGDPRDPKVDAADWVERIPFSETRNYVQRVMENLQVYRQRFGENTATVEANLHRAAIIEQPSQPAPLVPRLVPVSARTNTPDPGVAIKP